MRGVPRVSAGRKPAMGGRSASVESSLRCTHVGRVPGSPTRIASPRCGIARKTSSTVRLCEPGGLISPTNAHRFGVTRRPVSSSVSRRAQAAMLSPGRGRPPGRTQSSVPSPPRWMSRNASSRITATEQRTSTMDSSSGRSSGSVPPRPERSSTLKPRQRELPPGAWVRHSLVVRLRAHVQLDSPHIWRSCLDAAVKRLIDSW